MCETTLNKSYQEIIQGTHNKTIDTRVATVYNSRVDVDVKYRPGIVGRFQPGYHDPSSTVFLSFSRSG